MVVSARTSSRRQISGLTPRTTTRSWYTLCRGAGCMVSGMAPILALRTDGPGQGASHGLSRSRQAPRQAPFGFGVIGLHVAQAGGTSVPLRPKTESRAAIFPTSGSGPVALVEGTVDPIGGGPSLG